MRSIQNQLFEDIEIIFIDDNSNDNSVKIIKECQLKDERILLIKNKINKGTLISRNIGVIKSKGNYLLISDSDDMLSNNILKLSYNTAKKNQYELIRFNFFFQNHIDFNFNIFNRKRIPIFQPELSNFLFYGIGELSLHDYNICNKIIKRDLFIRTLNSIDTFYLKKYMIYFEDGFINFSLHLNAKSLFLMNTLGYYYIYNNQSVTNKVKTNLELINFCLYLKYIIENIKNQYKKNMTSYFLKRYINERINNTHAMKYIKNLYFFSNYFDKFINTNSK